MLKYKNGEDVGELRHWPFTGEASNYEVIRGEPEASGRIDDSGPTWRVGVWRCTAGTFDCNEPGDELQTILSGRVRIVRADGSEHEFGPGDSMFTYLGERMRWDVIEDVTKVFFGRNPNGF